jgi:hypothetical protein
VIYLTTKSFGLGILTKVGAGRNHYAFLDKANCHPQQWQIPSSEQPPVGSRQLAVGDGQEPREAAEEGCSAALEGGMPG